MTKANQFKALAVVAAMALALCLLAWVAVQPADAAFPGTNGKIAFERNMRIWSKSPDLAAPETKLRDAGVWDRHPAFSPDGSKVAFISHPNEIYVAKADGTGTPTRLTIDCLLDGNPAWSHDGTRIVFVRRSDDDPRSPCDGDYNIWTVNADGTGTPTQLTSDGLGDSPAWSVPVPGAPDGRIVYRQSSSQLWTMDPDGTDKTRLNYSCPTENGICDTSVGIPTFSPDGTKVAFDYSGDIYWTYASGVDPSTGLTPIAYPILRDRKGTETPHDDTEYPGDEGQAAWSPDGTKIAFQHNDVGGNSFHDIYTANADGSSVQATQITSGGGLNPDWQPIVPTIAINDVKVKERSADAVFTVRLAVAAQRTITVAYSTADGSAKTPADYTATSGTLTFAPGDTQETIPVPIKGDRRAERNETFFVNLSGATNTTIADPQGRATIIDND
jgi:Tol biopolymer transport system component